MQNRLQYNAYEGCSWCYQYGVYNRIIRYPFDLNFECRSHESHLQDVYMALQRKEATVNLKHIRQTFVRGVKVSSPMMDFQTYFNMVWSFPLEYMQGVLIGPVEQLWDSWVKKGIISAQDIRNINEHLALIKPVAEIHRLLRNLCKKSKWKASEWKSWLLFFSFPCLKNYLLANYLDLDLD